jgi:hypothetical protein
MSCQFRGQNTKKQNLLYNIGQTRPSNTNTQGFQYGPAPGNMSPLQTSEIVGLTVRLMLNISRLPNKDTFSVRNVKKNPSSPASKISAPIVRQQPSLNTKLYSSTPVKSDVIISVETTKI